MTEPEPEQTGQTRATVGTPTEQSRAFLQSRLALAYKVSFVLSLAINVALVVLPWTVLGLRATLAQLGHASFLLPTLATLLLAGLWWITSKTKIPAQRLGIIDTGATIVVSSLLSLRGVSLPQVPESLYQGALAIGLLLALRGIVVPSTAQRTLWVSLLASATSLAAAALLLPESGLAQSPDSLHFEWIATALWLAASTAVASVGSQVIYGLRREVREARRIGQYILQDKLGEGGMGIVYRATHAMLRRDTALKLLPPERVAPEALARFEREVRLTARLSHPNTIAIYDYGRTPEGAFYYAMEYLEGVNLHDLVQEVGPLPPARALYFLEQVCASLHEAHSQGLIHRDIKPANVIVTHREGTADLVKVLDFGLVKDLGDEDSALTATGAMTGTPLYMAPEAIGAPQTVGPASDLYSLAALGYYLLTGHHPFSGNTALEVCAGHLHLTPLPLSDRLGKELPQDLEALILQGLEKDPSKRPASARLFREALLQCKEAGAWSERKAADWWAGAGAALAARRISPDRSKSSSFSPLLAVDFAAR